MKKYLIVLLALLCHLSLFSQTNHTQELMDLIADNRWFEAEEYYRIYEDSITYEPVKYAYKGGIAKAFNNPHKAIEYFNEGLDKYYDDTAPLTLFFYCFYNPLRECYEQINDLDNANRIVEKIINRFKADESLGLTEEQKNVFFESLRQQCTQRYNHQQQYPKLRIDFGESENTTIPFDNSAFGLIRSEIKCNNHPAQAIFDTASGECIMSREAAEKLGVIIFEDSDWNINESTKAKMGMIDSLQIGTIMIYNIPVFINEEERGGIEKMISENISESERQIQLDKIDKFISSKDIIIGLPILNLLKRMELDYENKILTFRKNSEQNNFKRNLSLYNGGLYLSFTINDKAQLYTALFDTGGAHGLKITNNFLMQNNELFDLSIKADDLKQREMLGMGIGSNNLYLQPHKLNMIIGTTEIDLTNNCTIYKDDYLNENSTNNRIDLGIGTFDECKKIVIDFIQMSLLVE